MDTQRLSSLLAHFPALTLLVIGDYFLDRYLEIDPALAETSLETGLEAHQVVRVRCSPGAAGTVTSNLRSLGVNVIALGVIGDDGEGYELKRGLKATGVALAPLIETRERFTPTYTKPLIGMRELSRLDLKNRTPLPTHLEDESIARLRDLLPRVNGVIGVDQVQERNCGVITDRVRQAIATLTPTIPQPFVVESRERIGEFRSVIAQANAREARHAVSADSLEACGAELQRRNQRPALITIGTEGILVFEAATCVRVPAALVRGPIDTVGAGDSVIAGFTTALCAGASPREAAEFGNLVASVTIRQIGTTGTATPAQVLAAQQANE